MYIMWARPACSNESNENRSNGKDLTVLFNSRSSIKIRRLSFIKRWNVLLSLTIISPKWPIVCYILSPYWYMEKFPGVHNT